MVHPHPLGSSDMSGPVYRRGTSVSFRQLEGERGGVLLNLVTGDYHQVNQTGVLIWDALGQPASAAAVVESLAGELDQVPDHAESEVLAFLADLVERGLAEVETG
jgi:hypothetical protein